jgi:diaminopimelate epimerase
MQGIGNDYVYVDCFDQEVADPVALAVAISDRHFGVGGDGLILILPSSVGDVRMRMFNADGSESQMCGNGVRCVAKYTFDHGRSKANPMRVETLAGIRTIELKLGEDGKVRLATVDMGEPILDADKIPVNYPNRRIIDMPIRTSVLAMKMSCVSMGNPHAVMYVPDLKAVPLAKIGPEIENNPIFPQRINAHFVQVHDRAHVTMATWERGSGITLACGTGASAVCVAGVLTGKTDRHITAHLPGGDLQLEWRLEDTHVYMTGPAVEVFEGTWPT